jgi:hypothetical protein
LTWACKLATVLVRFSKSCSWFWKNCCMGSIGGCCCALLELLALPGRDTWGWSTPDPDLVFTIWVLGTLTLMIAQREKLKRLSSADFQFKTDSVDSRHSGITLNVDNHELLNSKR